MSAGVSPVPYMRLYGATVLRIILTPSNNRDNALACAQAALRAGFRVHVVLEWWNDWTPQQTAAYFQDTLTTFGPLAWAVSIGNEQELPRGGAGLTSDQYVSAWRIVEPIVRQLAPQAIVVGGEVAPWALSFSERALAAGLPGVQAWASHPYTLWTHYPIYDWLDLAAAHQVAAWFTEGLYEPARSGFGVTSTGAWGNTAGGFTITQPLSALIGAAVAGVWMGRAG